MIRILALPFALLALSSCASTAAPPGTPAAAATTTPALAGRVSYEVRSWGRLLIHWQVDPDGSGEIWRGVQGGGKGAGPVRKFRMRLSGDALRAFVRNVEDVRAATRNGIACKKEIYDLPYGSVTWDYPGAKQTYSFDAGCRSEEGDKAVEILGAASTVVETLAQVDAEPYITEPAPH